MSSSDSDSEWDSDNETSEESDITLESDLSDENNDDNIDLEMEVNSAPDGTQWTIDRQNVGQPPARNIRNVIRNPPGPKSEQARTANSPLSAFQLFFTADIIQEIFTQTNNKLRIFRANNPQHYTRNITIEIHDIYAYIGIRYQLGKDKNCKFTLDTLWNENDGDNLCKAAMSRHKFQLIHRMLRFDNIETRQQRRVLDRFAPIRNIYDNFVRNLPLYWTPQTHWRKRRRCRSLH